jgi:hypothetical protein
MSKNRIGSMRDENLLKEQEERLRVQKQLYNTDGALGFDATKQPIEKNNGEEVSIGPTGQSSPRAFPPHQQELLNLGDPKLTYFVKAIDATEEDAELIKKYISDIAARSDVGLIILLAKILEKLNALERNINAAKPV